MSTIPLDDAGRVKIDLPYLVESRLLVQANSGGGKSWTLRRILEQSFGKVQHLILDPEGEFVTLRQRYDYVVAGTGRDVPAEPRSAKLLARKLLEERLSAVLDIYELKAHDRVRFVRHFLEALVDAPKVLWHPLLVVVDEAHIYCPQKGDAESANAVIDLATRGRKRGYCSVLATQRLSKLHKDAAAECLPGHEMVICADRPKLIREVRAGDLVLTHMGRYRRVRRLLKRRYEGDMVRLKSSGFNLWQSVTAGHPVLCTHLRPGQGRVVPRLEEMSWLRAADVDRSEYQVLPRLMEQQDVAAVTIPYQFKMHYRDGSIGLRDRTVTVPVNGALMRVIGLYLAEGSLMRQGEQERVEWSFGKGLREEELAQGLAAALVDLGFHASVYMKRDCWHVQCASTALARWLRLEFGTGAAAKKVPLWVRRLPTGKLRVLVAAHCDGDGYRHPRRDGQADLSTVSLSLAVHLREMALKAGQDASLYRRDQHFSSGVIAGRYVKQKPLWTVRIGVQSGNRGSLVSDGAALYPRIRAVEKLRYEGDVYNLEVADDQSFCLLNGAVHNCNNKLIGRSALDVDMKRASEELGFTTREDQQQLRHLRPGQFFAFGPAISETVQLVEIGGVETEHPKVGSRYLGAELPSPTGAVLKAMARLADLPAEAEQEARDLASLRSQLTEARREITRLKRADGGVDEAEVKRLVGIATKSLNQQVKQLQEERRRLYLQVSRAMSAAEKQVEALRRALEPEGLAPPPLKAPSEPPQRPALQPERMPRLAAIPETMPSTNGISAPQLRILEALASLEPLGVESAARPALAALSGVSPSSGGYFNNLGRLRALGLVDYPQSGRVTLTDQGRELVPDVRPLQTAEELQEAWCRVVTGPQATILRHLIAIYPGDMNRDELAEAVGVSMTSGGYFNNLGRLHTLGAIEYPQKGRVQASPLLWPEGGR